ncbi:MAG TPA: phosphoribosylamine--glycine ligase [Candidatus Dormibacteraeota bacterium]|nr:phosphoribosylamine--glycine ligase [Candidatus Dormibacteraeota bacterium]
MPEAYANYDHLMTQEQLNVMVIGNGARERALAWKLAQSDRAGNILVIPSSPDNVTFARDPDNNIDLVVVGPDDDLAKGVVDDLSLVGIPTFGPTQKAARIESSKPYAKRLMDENGIPTATFEIFSDPAQAHEYIDIRQRPLYVKAGGLALGKGALECLTVYAAHEAVDDIVVRKLFGEAGNEVVIEDYLDGQEISFHAICDGETYHMFPSSQDHKKADEGDRGLNTGGMGTISPVPWFSQERVNESGLVIVKPILSAMHNEGNDFRGLLYPGAMVNDKDLNVLEYNARFGDPETQVYMRRLKSDLLDIITAALSHHLNEVELQWSKDFAVCIVAASGGYPGPYKKGKRIYGLDAAENMDGVKVFLAGASEQDGEYFTSGGRVLGVTAMGETLGAALDSGYAAMEKIRFEGKKVRSDIGAKALLNHFVRGEL